MTGRSIEFGWGAPSFAQQLPRLSSEDADKADAFNQAIIRLSVHGLLSSAERDRAIKRTTRWIEERLRARDQRAKREDGVSQPRPEAASPMAEGQAPDLIDELGDAASILRSNDAPYCASVVERAANLLQAPDLKALQAENERLKDERDAANAMVRQMSDALINLTPGGPEFYIVSEGGRIDAWGCVSYAKDLQSRLTTALAESERKRVEAETALAPFLAATWHYRAHAEPVTAADIEDGPVSKVDGLLISHVRRARLAAPTQETPHAQG